MADVKPDNADYAALIDAITKDKPLLVDGWTPLFPQNDVVNTDGFRANAFFNNKTKQIVIAFRGPLSVPLIGLALDRAGVGNGATTSDTMLLDGAAPATLNNDVTRFVKSVQDRAASLRLSTANSNIFVTGNSLGGYEAEFAAQQSSSPGSAGFGGANFGGPGIPGFRTTSSQRASNFITYINDRELGSE